MWTRAELKARGRKAFFANYWKCILVAVVLVFITSTGSSNGRDDNHNTNQNHQYEQSVGSIGAFGQEMIEFGENGTLNQITQSIGSSVVDILPGPLATAAAGILGGVALIFILLTTFLALALSIFVFNVIQVGCYGFFVANSRYPSDFKPIFANFRENYLPTVLTVFLRNLYTFLWSLLLVIPGIIKHYEYLMVPYILADMPGVSTKEAFAISREMMRDQKLDAFLLDLSFLGWTFLGVITLNILSVFYVTPYMEATKAELYQTLKGEMFSSDSNVYGAY